MATNPSGTGPVLPPGTVVHLPRTGVVAHVVELGAGAPVVLLHGGLEDGTAWAGLVPVVAPGRRVIVPDRRGHGGTPDVAGPYSYDAMAEETAELLERLGAGPADLVGFSDGGIIALLLAGRRPELVAGVVAISANTTADGLHPRMRQRLEHPDPDAPGLAPLREAHRATSPDGPGHWPVVHAKVSAMGAAGPGLTVDDLARITAPVLVVAADDDVVLAHHTLALAGAIADAQLAVVPGTSHLLLHEKPALLATLIVGFLADKAPHRIMPMDRLGGARG